MAKARGIRIPALDEVKNPDELDAQWYDNDNYWVGCIKWRRNWTG